MGMASLRQPVTQMVQDVGRSDGRACQGGLMHFLPAGDIDRLTGHVAGLVGGQEDHHVAHVRIRAAALHRYLVNIDLANLLLADPPVAGADGVDTSLPESIPG